MLHHYLTSKLNKMLFFFGMSHELAGIHTGFSAKGGRQVAEWGGQQL